MKNDTGLSVAITQHVVVGSKCMEPNEMLFPKDIDSHHYSNMEGADSNVYGHSDGSMTRTRAKQLQSALIS